MKNLLLILLLFVANLSYSQTVITDTLNQCQGDTITSTESYKQLGFEDFNSGNGFDFATSEEIDSMISVDSLGNMTTNNELFIFIFELNKLFNYA